MSLSEQIQTIVNEAEQAVSVVSTTQELEQQRVHLLGKKGVLTALLRSMGQMSPEERPRAGQMINDARQTITGLLERAESELAEKELRQQLADETLDVTEPRELLRVGVPHPCTMVLNEVLDCFIGMGFEVVEGPQVELDHYNFELLNIPKNHPARDAQDTFYI
jgi:phenylalanyl-tRNA synthetase alpha chain